MGIPVHHARADAEFRAEGEGGFTKDDAPGYLEHSPLPITAKRVRIMLARAGGVAGEFAVTNWIGPDGPQSDYGQMVGQLLELGVIYAGESWPTTSFQRVVEQALQVIERHREAFEQLRAALEASPGAEVRDLPLVSSDPRTEADDQLLLAELRNEAERLRAAGLLSPKGC
jgi:hypothetical protein